MVVHRLFFALCPPSHEREIIGGIRDSLGGLEKSVANDRLHMTMWISTDHLARPDGLIDRTLATMAGLDAPPVTLKLDRLVGLGRSVALSPSRKPAAARVVQRQLTRLLASSGALRPDWSFSPHVTLGYGENVPFSRTVTPVGWTADELVLIHSLVGQTKHIVLGRWPLIVRQGELLL